MMKYKVFGTFYLPRKRNAHGNLTLDLSKHAIQEFWVGVNEYHDNLSNAVGCYIFGVEHGETINPWYIGQAKQDFKRECFAHHKREIYRTVMNDVGRGKPLLIFVARLIHADKFKGNLAKDEAKFVENKLIHSALIRNPSLKNVRSTKFLREVQIPGFLQIGPGQPSAGAKLLKKTLGLE
ncbi:MAG: hypothetical protein OXG88_05660 [Gammaproteobacteria bacterium]|nr:hypothetical protein [Gammaproteobacteria bacterium]